VYGAAWGAWIKSKPEGRRPDGIERDLRSGALHVNAEGTTIRASGVRLQVLSRAPRLVIVTKLVLIDQNDARSRDSKQVARTVCVDVVGNDVVDRHLDD
jgi:hypothetical protein